MKKSVSMVILNEKREMLVFEHKKCRYKTLMPAGTLEDGETYLAAAIRELDEELGITVNKQKLLVPSTYRLYDRLDGFKVYDETVVLVESFDGVPFNKEPDKHKNMRYVSHDEIMNNLSKFSESTINASIILQKFK